MLHFFEKLGENVVVAETRVRMPQEPEDLSA